MYNLTVKNNYIWPLTANDGTVIAEKGGTALFNNQGNMIISVMGIGDINFIDLAKNRLPGYPIPTEYWGVLVRYHSSEAYYRYEGAGELTVIFDAYGSCTITTANGTMIAIKVPELRVN
jgi:hypothetical protein